MCFSFLLTSCATIVPPSGGEKDTTAPKIIYSQPANQSVKFTGKRIVFHFDEYIQIKNKLEISFFPEIKPAPKIIAKGKSIVIELLDDLKPNTTHIINFNNSIVDINESNPLENFQYVFSTGEIIDQCQLSGGVFDLKSNLKAQGAVVGLFKNKLVENFDSLIRNEPPDYFVFTNKNGQYHFSNLESENYILYATKDLNLSKNYEDGEPISMPQEVTLKNSHKSDISLFTENQFLKKDSLNFLYKKGEKDSIDIGSVNINFKKEIYETGKYIGEIMLNDSSVFCFHIKSNIVKIDSLLTGVYSFRMFEDVNKNNAWDSGNIKSLAPPEKIKIFNEKIDVKKDWEIDFYIE